MKAQALVSEVIPTYAVCKFRRRVASLLQSSNSEYCMCRTSLEVQNALYKVKDVYVTALGLHPYTCILVGSFFAGKGLQ